MNPILRAGLALLLLGALAGCASTLDRGEQLYRQGDVLGAVAVWQTVEEGSGDYEQARARIEVVRDQLERTLRRYEKRAAFFESEGRLAEAVIYYRLAYRIDPEREGLLERVQKLARNLRARTDAEHDGLEEALARSDLRRASQHAATLELLDPFDPAVQIDVRHVRAATGARVLQHMSAGETAYAAGNRRRAQRDFEKVLVLDPSNERALGYLSYIKRFRVLEAERQIPPPPSSITKEEIIAEGHYRSAQQAENAGETFWAITQYEAALAVNARHPGARRSLTSLRSKLHPQVQELYELGKRYFQEEDLHNALRAWRQALAIDPADERTRDNVERAERMLARLEEIQTSARPDS